MRGAIPFLDLSGTNARHRDEMDLAFKSVLEHGQFVGGPEVEEFEDAFASYCGSSYCVGVANGTDALELILAGLGIGVGDEVILPANTFIATAEAVCAVGARPRFADVLSDTLQIDPAAVLAAAGPRTAAIIAVHLFGHMADVDRLAALATRLGLPLIEDAAQAHGATFGSRRAGSVGVAAGFSFYPGKNLGALGDGGAVVSSDAELIGRIRHLANHGRAENDRYLHTSRGRNSRLDTLQAGVLTSKLHYLDAENAHRRTLMQRYREQLPASIQPVMEHPLAEPVHHLAVVQVPDRGSAISALDTAGIGWGIHYPVPCHRQPAYMEFADGPLPVADQAAAQILSLPMSPSLTAADVDRVCAVLALDAQ